jgi:outer membrane protein OmpA-like peptidoglycan-associated protein
MIRNTGLLLISSFILGLGACTSALPPEKTEALGAPFNEELKNRYLELAASRRSSLDFDYFHFREKAEASLLGDVVQPDSVGDHDICLPWQPEALAARERLLDLLDQGGRYKAPGQSATAQVDFDCWLDELEGQSQASGACTAAQEQQASPAPSQCGERLMADLDLVEAAMAGDGAPYAVFFGTGKTSIDSEGEDVLARVKRDADLVQPARIVVTGYADRRGVASQNKELAEKRAREVAKGLIEKGVPAAAVVVDSWGETISADSLEENRRVEITFEN